MRAVIVGAGFAGRAHAAALRTCGVEIAAVVTTREQTAKAFACQWNIPHFGTDISVAFEPEVDAVHVCTPPMRHGELIRELLAHGKHVVCEKPLSLDAAEARELAALARMSGSLCALSFNVRHHMACRKAREIMASGTLGRPLIIHGNYLQEFHALPSPADWRYNESVAGTMRAVTEIGSHWVDLAQYISGLRVEAVSASFGRFWTERVLRDGIMYPVGECGEPGKPGKPMQVLSEDAAAVTMRFENGVLGNVMLSEVSPGRGNHLALEITCEHGALWWNEEDNNRLYTARKGEGVHTEIFAFGNGFDDTFAMMFQNFYAAVAAGGTDAPSYPTFEEGAYVTAVCCAMGESAANDSRWTAVRGGDSV